MSTRIILITSGLILLLAAGASAQGSVNSPGIFFGPQLGYQKASDADNGKLMGGLAMRLKTFSLGAEGSINYREETYAHGDVTVRNWPVMATGFIYPIPIAYGAIGAGWYNTTVSYDQHRFPGKTDETKQQIGWHFGGGLEIPAGNNVLTADIRYVFLNYDFAAVPGGPAISSDFYVITLGYLFGL